MRTASPASPPRPRGSRASCRRRSARSFCRARRCRRTRSAGSRRRRSSRSDAGRRRGRRRSRTDGSPRRRSRSPAGFDREADPRELARRGSRAFRGSPRGGPRSSPGPAASAAAAPCWSGVAVAKVMNWCAARTAAASSGGAIAQPIFQPVSENVLPKDEIVIVRSRIPGSVAIGTCRPSYTRCSYTSSVMQRTSALAAERGHDLELLAGEDLARRVVRRVQQHGARARAEGGGELARIEGPVGRAQRHDPRHGAGHAHARLVGVVVRLEEDDLVAGVADALDRREDRLGRAGGHGDLRVGRVVESPVAPVLRRQRAVESPGSRSSARTARGPRGSPRSPRPWRTPGRRNPGSPARG